MVYDRDDNIDRKIKAAPPAIPAGVVALSLAVTPATAVAIARTVMLKCLATHIRMVHLHHAFVSVAPHEVHPSASRIPVLRSVFVERG